MALSGFHLRVAQLLGEATGQLGFGLGGGYGLQAHRVTDRPSKDLDAYVNSMDVEVFAAAERALCERLEAEGLQAEVVGTNDWFRAILVSGSGPDERVVVDLAYDYRANPPVIVEGIGPVLDIEDIVVGKVRAFVDRGAERDYSDIGSLLDSGRWTIGDLFGKARSINPKLPRREFAERLRRVDHLDLEEFAAIGIGPRALARLQQRLARAAYELVNETDGLGGLRPPSSGHEPPGLSL